MSILVYSIAKGEAPQKNFIELTKNEGFIYWDNAKFKKTNTGDKVFVTNVSKGTWYLTELIDNDIPITRDDDQDCITFNEAGYLYNVPDAHRWGNFVKLKILEKTENKFAPYKNTGAGCSTFMENDGGNGEIRIKQLQDVFNNSTTPLAAKLLEDLYLKTENTKDSNIILKGKTQGMYLLKRIKTQDSKGEFFIPNKFLGKDKFFPSPKDEDPYPDGSDPYSVDLYFKWNFLNTEIETNPLKKYRSDVHSNTDTRLARTPRLALDGDPITIIKKNSSHEYEAWIYKKGDKNYDKFDRLLGDQRYLLTDNINLDIKEKPKMKYPLNQILYGPPGTGKTYSTITKALNIIGLLEEKDNYTKEEYEEAQELFQGELGKRIEFVTMHQSFSYEDFVQGLKPLKPKKGEGVIFDYKNGVFKEICRRANLKNKEYDDYHMSNSKVDFDLVIEFAFKDLIENDQPVTIERGNTPFKIHELNDQTLWFETSKGTKHERYTLAKKTLKAIYEEGENKIITSGNKGYFDAALDYLNKKSVELQKKLKTKLNPDDNRNFVIILDEINRANISRVFGELIALIEKDKRDGKLTATLPSGEAFTVPSNLHIIGTMNTADKSIALVDIALRRRFEFKALYPDPNILKKVLEENGFSNDDTHQRVNMLSCLNRIIRAKKSVDFEIGHSYFMDNDTLVNILNKQVLPLLNEYFMYDLKKVKEIIEKTQKDKEGEAIPKPGIIFNNQIWKDRGLLEVESIKSAEDNLDVVETDETTQD